jgi:hypothetical protein
MTTVFDTLKYVEALKAAGISEDHARGQAQALAEALADGAGGFATKADLLATKADLLESDHRLEERMTRFEGRMSLLQWMLGFNLALVVLVLGLLLRGLP